MATSTGLLTDEEVFGRPSGATLTDAQVFGEGYVQQKFPENIVFGNPDKFTEQPNRFANIASVLGILDGKRWDESLTTEQRAEIRSVSGEDYNAMGSKAINSLVFADMMQTDPQFAFDNHNDIARTVFGAEAPPEKILDRVKLAWQNGKKQVELGDFGYQIIIGQKSVEENLPLIRKLQSEIKPDALAEDRNIFERMLVGTTETAPISIEAIKRGGKGALVGGVAGGVFALIGGVLIPAPEEVVTVPAGVMAGVKLGTKVGLGVGAADRIRQIEAGMIYIEMLDFKDEQGRGIDPRVAAYAAHSVGLINGGLELAEWGIILSTFGIGTKTFEKAASKVTSKIIKGGLKQVVLKKLVQFSLSLTGEVVTEDLQESTSIVFGELAKAINNETKGTDIKPITGKQIFDRLLETTEQSALSFPLLLAPGTVVSTIKQGIIDPKIKAAIETKEQTKVQNAKNSLAAEIVRNGVVEDEAVKIANETIDSEVVNSKEVTDKDIQTLSAETEKPATPKDVITARVIEKVNSRLEELSKVKQEFDFKKSQEDSQLSYRELQTQAKALGVKANGTKKALLTRVNEATAIQETILTPEEAVVVKAAEADAFKLERIEGGFVIKEILTDKEVKFIKKRKPAKAKLAELNKEPKPIKGVKRKPKILTGKDVAAKIITESRALNAALKKAAVAAQKAFSVGKAEGIAQARQQIKDIQTRRRALKELGKRIDDSMKVIKAPNPKGLDIFYIDAIDNLITDIDPSFFKRAKTAQQKLRRKQRSLDFLSRNPEKLKDFPRKLLERLLQKSANEYTVDELDAISKGVKDLRTIGKVKSDLIRKREIRERNETIGQLKNVVGKVAEGIDPDKPLTPQTLLTTKEGFIKSIRRLSFAALRPTRLFDLLDGRKGTFSGIWHRTFYDIANAATNDELVKMDKRQNKIQTKMDELDIKPNDLAEVRVFNNAEFIVEEMMGVYAAMQNQHSHDAIRHGNHISDRLATQMITNLDKKFLDLADFIITEYNENFSRLREAYSKATGVDLSHEENYTPMVRMLRDSRELVHTDLASQLNARNNLRLGYVNKGFTIDRIEIAPEHQSMIDIRLVSTWMSQAARQEHYIAFAKLTKDYRAILRDSSLQRTVKENVGVAALNEIGRWVDRVADPDIYKNFTGIENMSRTLRRNLATAYLSFNLMTIARQLPSLTLYTEAAGPMALMSSIVEYVANPIELTNRVRALDPQVKHASIEREIEELKNINPIAHQKIINKIGRFGFLGIAWMDSIARTIGWNAVYQKSLSLRMSEAEAIDQAQKVTLRTQPAARAKDIAGLYSTSEYLNWMTMFTNQLNQIWNITTYDIYAHWNNQEYLKSALTLVGTSISALIIWMLNNQRMPEEDEDFIEIAQDQFLNSFPLIGRPIFSFAKGYGIASPPVKTGTAAVRLLKILQEGGDIDKAMVELLTQLAALKGVPIIAGKRGLEFIESGEIIELFGGEK